MLGSHSVGACFPLLFTAFTDRSDWRALSGALGATLRCVPTTRPRHPVTETDDIAAILDEAARRWPDASRAKLIRLVLQDWADGGASPSARTRARAELVGSLPGSSQAYDRNLDWPK